MRSKADCIDEHILDLCIGSPNKGVKEIFTHHSDFLLSVMKPEMWSFSLHLVLEDKLFCEVTEHKRQSF